MLAKQSDIKCTKETRFLKSPLRRQSWLTEMYSHQAEWREEVKQHFEKIKSDGTCLHRLDEELINRRREELRFAFYC